MGDDSSGGNAAGWIALIVAVIVLFLITILYTLYYLNLSNYQTYGSKMNFVNVSDGATSIAPVGNAVYSVNGNSTSRGTNPDYLLIRKPCDVVYENIPFIIYNNSNLSNLTLNFDSAITVNNTPSPYIIDQQAGVWFMWINSTTLIPLVAGTLYSH
jgi:hypothetical protein